MVRRALCSVALVCGWLMSLPALAAITTELDRIPLVSGETFTLTLSIDKDVGDEPDLSALSQLFKIVGTSSVSQQQIVNGKASSQIQRIITLLADQPGTYHIPAIRWAGEESNPIEVRVVPPTEMSLPGMEEPLFMKAEIERKDPYVQSEVVLTVRVYYAMQIYNKAEFKPLVLDNVLVEPLGKESQYQTRLRGKTYGVIEKRYALFPQKPGPLTIPAIRFETEVASGRRGGFPLDIFNRTSEEHLESEPLTIEVQPKPAGASEPWLPARSLRLGAELTPNATHFKVGDPLTWTLTLEADGLSETQLPTLMPGGLTGVKTYPDAPALSHAVAGDRLVARRVEKIAVIPTAAGTLKLPAVQIVWWNTETGKPETASIPAREIPIEASPVTVPSTPATQPRVQDSPLESPVPTPSATAASLGDPGYWPWLAGFLGLGWLSTLLAWWWQRLRTLPAPTGEDIATTDRNALRTALERALKANDANASRRALEQWARAHGHATVNGYAQASGQAEFIAAVSELNAHCYAGASAPWQGQALLRALKQLRHPQSQAQAQAPLPALYPGQ